MIRFVNFVIAIALGLCVPAWAGTLEGQAWYRERIALPPDAAFEAVLLDASRADAPGETLGRARLDPAGQPPFRFEIHYDDAAIRAGRRYALRAVVTVGGRPFFVTDRNYPAFVDGGRPVRMLLVRARADGDRPPLFPTSEATRLDGNPLRNTYWKLTRLGETPTRAAERQREAHLIFSAHELRVSGSGGCNRIAGAFELDGDKLRLGRMAGTMMACPSGMEQERRFLQSLGAVERYRISGDRLELLNGAGAVVARFERVALR